MKKNIVSFMVLIIFSLIIGTVIGRIEKADPPKVLNGDYQKYIKNEHIKIKLFGVDNCIFCKKLRVYLDENNIKYIYANLEEGTDSKSQFEKLGGSSLPLTIIGDSLIRGFNKNTIKEELIKQGYKVE